MGEGSHGLGRNQQELRVGCWAMVGDYSEDSSGKENFNLLLCLARVETNIDLKGRRAKVLEGHLQENKDVGGFRDNSWQRSVA